MFHKTALCGIAPMPEPTLLQFVFSFSWRLKSISVLHNRTFCFTLEVLPTDNALYINILFLEKLIVRHLQSVGYEYTK